MTFRGLFKSAIYTLVFVVVVFVMSSNVPTKTRYVTVIDNELFAPTAYSLQPSPVSEELGEASPSLKRGVRTDPNTPLCGAQTSRCVPGKPAAKQGEPLMSNETVIKNRF